MRKQYILQQSILSIPRCFPHVEAIQTHSHIHFGLGGNEDRAEVGLKGVGELIFLLFRIIEDDILRWQLLLEHLAELLSA